MEIRFFDGELHVMDVLWQEGDRTARQIAESLQEKIGWNVNTTYTMIKRCIAKGAIQRTEPHFLCHALVSREEAQAAGVNELVDRLFDGSTDRLLTFLLSGKALSREQIERLRQWIEEQE